MKIRKSKSYLTDQKGQTTVEYILVVAVLVLGIAAAFLNPDFKNAFASFYNGAGSRIVKPGK